MSRVEKSDLPANVRSLLNGARLEEKVGDTILLITVSETGWPHLAMLSVGEMLAVSPTKIRIALWQGTASGKNLARDGKATFVFILDGAGVYVEAVASPEEPLAFEHGPLDSFMCDVAGVLIDEVDYATLTGGIGFVLPDAPSVLERWRTTIDAMGDR